MPQFITRPAAALLAALALPALAVPALAQGPAAPATTPQSPARWHRLTPAERAARIEARISNLHDQLGITAEQQPKWDQFAGVMRSNAKNMEQSFHRRGAELATMSAAANMQSYADLAVAHAQDVQRLAVAFQSVYDSLSPAQKAKADAMFRHQGPAGRHAPHAAKP